jgi:hypothetical protein
MSTYTDNLQDLGLQLRLEGWDSRAITVLHAAQRMESMEELIRNLMEGDQVVEESKQCERKITQKPGTGAEEGD